MQRKNSIEALVAEVLDGTELVLRVDSYSLNENLETGEVSISCDVHHEKSGEQQVIEGKGVGIVDALFHGFVDIYSQTYHSLETIRFVDFSVAAHIDRARTGALTDSSSKVTLCVANSEEQEFLFTHESPSSTRSSIEAVLQAAEFFVNSERAFIAVYRALDHARKENRVDSVARYTKQLTTLVGATSYTEVIDKIRREELSS